MVRMQIQFTEEQQAELRRQARMRGISISAFVREAVDRELDRDVTRQEAWARLLSVVGLAHGGGESVAENHDDYLVKVYAEE